MTRILPFALLALALASGCSDDETCPLDQPGVDLAAYLCQVTPHPQNPLLEPPNSEFLLGDPTVLHPSEAPDGQTWHLWANGLQGVYHFTSTDGLSWSVQGDPLFGLLAFRSFIHRGDDGRYTLLFEKFSSPQSSTIQYAQSKDLTNWSAPKTLLSPTLAWEKENATVVGNPYLTRRDGVYWLYYSASAVWLDDAKVYEPKYIGVARASSLTGPYKKEAQPLIRPSSADPLHNLGAGSIKLLDRRVGGKWLALNNGIYRDQAGKSRSAITVLQSDDGLSWSAVCAAPIIAPTDSGWTKALIYAFDTVDLGDRLYIYYNARDDWYSNSVKERIGLSTLSWPCAEDI